jgi:hypothetical protein
MRVTRPNLRNVGIYIQTTGRHNPEGFNLQYCGYIETLWTKSRHFNWLSIKNATSSHCYLAKLYYATEEMVRWTSSFWGENFILEKSTGTKSLVLQYTAMFFEEQDSN